MLMRSRRIQWNGCRVHDAASGLWSGSSITGDPRRSVLMTPPVPEKVRVLSPAWYRAAVEFQGRPEQERLAFCSWCCCHGGCNLCADISKYNIKGLKIYGG